MTKALRVVPFAVIAGFLCAAPAQAVTIVDFTGATWAGVNGTNTFTDPGSGITIDSIGGNMTFNSELSERAGCASAGAGLACEGDGIGINDDEVTGIASEVLVLSFPTLVDVFDVHVLDLFRNEAGGLNEFVGLSTDGVTYTFFESMGLPGGYRETGFSATGVSTLYLKGQDNPVSDVALARLAYAPVPESATLALLGLGLTGLGLRARRRRQ